MCIRMMFQIKSRRWLYDWAALMCLGPAGILVSRVNSTLFSEKLTSCLQNPTHPMWPVWPALDATPPPVTRLGTRSLPGEIIPVWVTGGSRRVIQKDKHPSGLSHSEADKGCLIPLPLKCRSPDPCECPANTKHLYNIYTTLDQRRRRWACKDKQQ